MAQGMVKGVDWCRQGDQGRHQGEIGQLYTFRSVGSNANTVEDIVNGPDGKVMRGLQAGIDAANREAVSNAQKIQKWMILPRDFSIPGGEIGPTMKVKRQAVTKMYQKQIEKIYAQNGDILFSDNQNLQLTIKK